MPANSQLRFVILEHDYPTVHWDFMLESAGTLRTWRLLNEPAAGIVVRSEPIADHRIEYLDYEGPVSRNRGNVVRWDTGTYVIQTTTDEQLTVVLAGTRLSGTTVIEPATTTFG